MLRAAGRTLFHAIFINLSYRNRGKVARTQTQKNLKQTTIQGVAGLSMAPLLQRTLHSKAINIILAYSAIKIKANPPPPYSILNPDTSSDSPSAKSNGVRFVSATQATTQNTSMGAISTRGATSWLILAHLPSLLLVSIKREARRNRASLIS